MFRTIRSKFYIIIVALAVLLTGVYVQLAYFVDKIAQRDRDREIAMSLDRDVGRLAQGFWESSFWEKVILEQGSPEAERNFGVVLARVQQMALQPPPGIYRDVVSVDLKEISGLLKEYESLFSKLIQLRNERSLAQTRFDSYYQILTSYFAETSDLRSVKSLLILRQFQEDYLRHRKESEYGAAKVVLDSIEARFIKTAANADQFSSQIKRYKDLFDEDFYSEQQNRAISIDFDKISSSLEGLFLTLSREVNQLSTKEMLASKALMGQLLGSFLISVLIGIFLFVLVIMLIVREIIKPIRQLSSVVKCVKDGNMAERFVSDKKDDIAILGYAFNEMLDTLEHDKRQLVLYQQDLEKMIVDLKRAEEQLVQSEKMASLGQLSAGVAHEINNPLLFIMGNLSILRNYLDSYKKAIDAGRNFVVLARRDAVESAKRQIEELSGVLNSEELEETMKDTAPLLDQTLGGLERVKKIVLDLKTFARSGTEAMEKKDINEVVEGAVNICLNELKYKVELIKDYAQLPLVMCNAQKLGQVFINLLLNSVQAIEGKGTIHIETSQKNDMVCVKIKDSGKGIPKENLKKIFDPFFTTKSKGTGLGLSVSYDIIKRHGGQIVVESEVGRGTTMTVMLPIQANVVPEA
jgi:signal transduction histidine kinase